MSKYTTELRYIVEQEILNHNAEITPKNWYYAYDKIGLATYPIFDELYRSTLNTKIIRHYYTREICAETCERFKMFVEDAMNLIMPLYNQFYESEIIAKDIQPLKDMSLKLNEHAWGRNTNDGRVNTSSNTQSVFQDTPASEMIPQQIKELKYATNVNIDEAKSNNASTNNGSYDNMIDRLYEGFNQSQSQLLQQYRKTFLNIDNDIINDTELSQCFLTIW